MGTKVINAGGNLCSRVSLIVTSILSTALLVLAG